MYIIKIISACIVTPLSDVCNRCLPKGYLPKPFKYSKITTIFKCGDKEYPDNYKPISIISSIGKILEQTIVLRFNDSVANIQYGDISIWLYLW